MKLIDISGYGHSGKTSVTNLLSEVDGLKVHDPSFEFNLLRLPDGIKDLYLNICREWTPIKSDRAIKRFMNLVKNLDADYSEILRVNFSRLSKEYIEKLIFDELEINWYDSFYKNQSSFKSFVKRLFIKFHLISFYRNFFKTKSNKNSQLKDKVFLLSDKNFIEHTQFYLEQILSSNKRDVIVTNNAFEPFNPSQSLQFFKDAYSIVVDRDPRDIYLSSLNYTDLYIPDFEKKNKFVNIDFLSKQKKDFLASNNIETFIWRQKILRKNVNKNYDKDKVLRINYEDLIYNYEQTISLIFDFLKIDKALHHNKLMFFDPNKSKKNVGLWKEFSSNEILKIEIELKEYLYNF